MQLYLVTWKFESSEYQTFAKEALINYVENEENNGIKDGYERIAWIHTPQDGTGVIICRAESAKILYQVFNPWREHYGITWTYKPGLSTEELISLIKESQEINS